ncbi:gliding motility-associated ABC transporter substrate-binding protein GldG [Sphingobacterium sp. SGG-5]|uniref:gliding motility-associated ABC transporter substrate-binding protein GldG n=1 Tax=Sphingobacterium sp. SGG-5 TaxID=2710881 RepID=UPI0013ECBF01|nr:gliding motility-associated ABC transporter substrate-binding protein GldG [Sphingobacterium sp. SGG-5]NGM62295.1 gliding motility-associated ABC transporter substrate-binding protein GldG [Sphingobacterium sp. SGG-5]
MYSIYSKEVASYFNALIGYLAIGLFLLLTGLILWIFPDTSILDAGYASMEGFFGIAPYLLIFLVPAVTMRSIAGEKADGTYDLLLSRPLTLAQIVIGKYLGGLTIACLAVLPTVVYAVTLYFLAFPQGNIDLGAIIGSYVGLLLLCSAFTSLSLFCSSLTKNVIVAFLLAVFACFITFYAFGATAEMPIFYNIQEYVKNWGIQEHYEAVSRGVLTARDFLYFLSFTGLFLLLSIGHLGRQQRPRKQTLLRYAGSLILLLLVNQSFVYSVFGRIDFTADKRFTLSNTTKDIVKKIDKELYINIFLDGDDLPSGFQRLRKAALDMAHDLKSYSGGKIKVNVIDPLEGDQSQQSEFTQALINRGLYPTNLSVKTSSGFSQKLIFPAAVVHNDTHEVNVTLLQNRTGLTPEQVLNNSIQNLEYAFVSAIMKINKETVPYIGFTEGHGEPTDLELYDAMHTLAVSNQVGRLHLDSIALEDLKQIKVIVIAQPTKRFSESDKYKLDYYVRHGGNIIWAIDQIDASLDNLRQSGGAQPLIGRELNLDDQLFLYGVRLNYDMIADLNCSQIPLSVGNIAGQAQIELAPWYFFPILMPTSQHPIVKNLDGIRTEFIGTIDTIATTGITKEVLLQSSPFTRILHTPSTISLQMVEEQPDPATFRTKPAPVAMLLQGKFPYIFKDRPAPDGIAHPVDVSDISQTAKMLVIADGDWLINQVSAKDQSPFPLGWDRYTEQQYANKLFLENTIDYLLYDESLIALRNREVKLRLLDQAKVKDEKITWQIVNVGCPLLLLVLIGTAQQLWRKRKYTHTVR